MELVQYTTVVPWGSGQWYSCGTLPHCLGAVGSRTPTIHCRTTLGQWAVVLSRNTAALPWGSGQWNSYGTLPHRLGAVGSRTPAIHCYTALGQWAVVLLQYTPTIHCRTGSVWGSGQWNACGTPLHCLGAVGSGTRAVLCRTVGELWAVDHLQYNATLLRSSFSTLPHCVVLCALHCVVLCHSALHCEASCGVVWCGVVWCGVVWCGVVWCGVVWCGVVWCGVVWCGVVWCGVVWCGVVWCGVV